MTTGQPATAADQAAQKELQSSLLRISIICASSIQSLREPTQPTILSADEPSSPPTADKLSSQIASDLAQLLALVQKHTTNLALALKPSLKSTNTASSNGSTPISPVSGLDAKSLQAAQSQIVSLGSDLLPKIVFLAKKAWKDRQVFQQRSKADQTPAQIEERRKLEQMAKEMGGQLMSADRLGIPPSERDDLEKKLKYSLGNSFAREIRSVAEDVIGSIADLLHSLLDDRAKKALQQASEARDRADGINGVSSKLGSLSLGANPDPAELRKRTLAANNLVWETCAKYIGERNSDGTPRTITSVAPNGVRTKVQVKGLSKSNLEACKRSWSNRVELMRDGLHELKEGTEAEQNGTAAEEDDGEEFSFPAATPLSSEQKDRLRQLSNLVKMGNLTHGNILKEIAKAGPNSGVDLDEVEELGKQLEESQDELVAACLYGETDAGLEAKMFDPDAEDDQDVDGKEDEEADADLTEEQAIEKAILRTFEQYVQAVVSLSAYVTDREELVEKVNVACATDEEGDFAKVFGAKFNRLSKVLSEASGNITLRTLPVSSTAANADRNHDQSTFKAKVQHKPIPQANDEFSTSVFISELESIASSLGPSVKVTDREIASHLDSADPLKPMRQGYILPTFKDVCSPDYPSTSAETAPDAESLYMCGNSLGPLSRLTKKYLEQEIDAWGRKAVLGHFEHPYGTPWTQMEKRVGELCANVVGAKESEVVVMATLTGNLHSLLATFYRPATKPFGVDFKGDGEQARREGKKVKHKIIFEQKAFPSDQYALASVIELNGFNPETSLVPLVPKEGTRTLETADILATIEKCGQEGETAIILIGGIQYFTGQLFELEKLAKKAHEYGVLFGVDLAHAFANVPLALHDWGVDFACWCTYKYGSSGPGGIAGLFVHEKWHQADLKRQAGWWGHEKETRFSMPDKFVPTKGAEGWQTSNPSMLDMAALKGSLETLLKAEELGERNEKDEGRGEGKHGKGTIMPVLRRKSLRLTAYLEVLLLSPGFFPDGFDNRVVTPKDPLQRGSQLCIQIPDPPQAAEAARKEQEKRQQQEQEAKSNGKDVPPPIDGKKLIARAHKRAEKQRGLVADIRSPDMLRLAPLAQFSTYGDVWRTADVLRQSLLDEVEAEKSAYIQG
ncbi:uncharacterized protein UHO2_05119 [Ustilago hordei]|uniref:Kynureninase n=1 Tax=Ustilago hordei TaxID=120017 RepID=I2FQX0_USTHO|nr:uncharacterized protein UHO2_05119 [Ustilago hordei]CCF49313.1 related to kynureninase [Ustilago hordei]SYW79939.1 related to kynureninase [Ustilago hordei]